MYQNLFRSIIHDEANDGTIKSMSSYKYIFNFLTTFDINDYEDENDNLEMFYKNSNEISESELKKIKKLTEKDLELPVLRSYLQVKSRLDQEFGINYFDENEIIRYVISSKCEIELSYQKLIELYKWREEFDISDLKIENFKNLNYHKFLYFLCKDKYNRPVIMFKCGLYEPNSIDIDSLSNYVIFLINTVIKEMPSYIDKIVFIIDLKNTDLNNINPGHIIYLRNIMEKYFAERCSEIYVINRGIIFNTLWRILSRCVDSEFLKKFSILDTNYVDNLRKFIDIAKLKFLI